MDGLTCAKCGSEEVIPSASLLDHWGPVLHDQLQVQIDGTGKGWLRSPIRAPVRVRICGKCGYSELFVDEPSQLYRAFKAAGKQAAGIDEESKPPAR